LREQQDPVASNLTSAAGERPQFDVAVIGCGPVGALGAILLAQAGLRVAVIEQNAKLHPLPRAVHMDHEGMRLLQAAGIASRLAGDVSIADGHLHIGADLGVIRYLSTVGRPRPFGWADDYFFFQPELEAQLRSRLEELADVHLRLGVRVESLQQRDEGVQLYLSTASGPKRVAARWVIACDGAHSQVRKLLGIAMKDFGFEESWLVVDAEVDGSVRFPPITGLPATADLQRLSVMFCDPRRPTTVVPGRRGHRRWEFMLLPGEHAEDVLGAERLESLLAPWLEGVPHQILRAATYRFHGLVAESWRIGRVFLAGDAAHQTPPFFGQGMCHGMRDVANLAWKLALVESGAAHQRLLDSYQAERSAHVHSIVSSAIEAGRYICLLEPEAARHRDQALRQQATQGRPVSAGDLIPALSTGVIAAGSPGAGVRFIQPRMNALEGSTLLDHWTGGGWRIFVRDAHLLTLVARAVSLHCRSLELQLFDASGLADSGATHDWLCRHEAAAVIVRPDFYVFGTAGDEGSIGPLLRRFAESLSLGGTVEETAGAATQH
jgi:3-(3-hydroxy-phenyl)propionate hydroxylase